MCTALRTPWILQAVLDAEAIPLQFRPGKRDGGGRCQIIQFTTYRTESDPKALIWGLISDKNHYITVVFSTACTDSFEKRNEHNLTQMRMGVIIVNRCILRYGFTGKGRPQEFYLEIRKATKMCSDMNPTFGEPKNVMNDNEIQMKMAHLMEEKMQRKRKREKEKQEALERRLKYQQYPKHQLYEMSDNDRRVSLAQQALLDTCHGWNKPTVPKPAVESQPPAYISNFTFTNQQLSLLTDDCNAQEPTPISGGVFLKPSPYVRPRPHPKMYSPAKTPSKLTADHSRNDSGDESAKESDTTSMYSVRTRRDMCVREGTFEIQMSDSAEETDSDDRDDEMNTPAVVHHLMDLDAQCSERSMNGYKASKTRRTGPIVRSQTKPTQDERRPRTAKILERSIPWGPTSSCNIGQKSPSQKARLNSVDVDGSVEDRENRRERSISDVDSPCSTVSSWSNSGSESEWNELDDAPYSFPLTSSDSMPPLRYMTQPDDWIPF